MPYPKLLGVMFGLMCCRADELVQRVFTLDYFPRRHSLRILKCDMINSVRRHALDMGSSESKSELEVVYFCCILMVLHIVLLSTVIFF